MENRGYKVGRFLGQHWAISLVVAGVLSLYIFAKTTPSQSNPTSPLPLTQAQVEANATRLANNQRAAAEKLAKCNAEAPAIKKAADSKSMAGNPMAARSLINACNGLTLDPQNRSLLDSASKLAETVDADNMRRAAAAEKKRLKSEGVSIGMTPEQVVASSWGKPRKINRTTGANYQNEQWVYDGGYLYFKDGILRTIQN
jgi:cytoskeletal protein RodZ